MHQLIEAYPWIMIIVKMFIAAFVTKLLAAIIKLIQKKNLKNQESLFRKFIFSIIYLLVYLFGVIAVIGQVPQLSKVVQTILAGSGILALGLSLSAQESLNNVISGLFISLFKPFEKGDRVTLVTSKITGTIEDITLRHTIIKTFTNTRIVIPNSKINNEIIENSNLIDARASSFIDVTVAYESDIDNAMQIVSDVISSHPSYLDIRTEEEKKTTPTVKVYIRELGNNGIILRANMWTRTVNENFDACSDVRLQIKKRFDEAGIEIPYSKHTILYQTEGEPIA